MRRHLPILTPGIFHRPTPFGLYMTETYSHIGYTPRVTLSSAGYYYVPGDPDLPEYLSSIIEKYHPIHNISKGMANYYTPPYKLMKSIYHKGNTPLYAPKINK